MKHFSVWNEATDEEEYSGADFEEASRVLNSVADYEGRVTGEDLEELRRFFSVSTLERFQTSVYLFEIDEDGREIVADSVTIWGRAVQMGDRGTARELHEFLKQLKEEEGEE